MSMNSFSSYFTAGRCYFDSATMGLCPLPAAQEMKQRLDEIVSGTCSALVFDSYIERSRRAFASIVDVPEDWVSIIPAVSVGTAVLSANLDPGQRVLVAEEDFTSVLFPFLQAQQRGVEVIAVPLEELIDRIDESLDWVAVSAVQSKDGRILDLAALAAACRTHHVRSYVDLTQAAGWLETGANRFDITVTGAYKWLMSPRGSGFMTVQPTLWSTLPPVAPGWYAGEYPWESIYSPPLRLASNARRYDISPAWLCWAGAAVALELLVATGIENINRHNTGLAENFSQAFGQSSDGSAIVSLQLTEAQVAAARSAQLVFSERGGSSRFSFHAYNTTDQVESALDILQR